VKALPSNRLGVWICSTRIEGALYLNDGLTHTLTALGTTKRLRLEAQGFNTIAALRNLTEADIDCIAALPKND